MLRQPHGITVTLVRSFAGSFLGAPTEAADVASELNERPGRDLVHNEVSGLPPSSLLIPFTGEREGGEKTIKRSVRPLCPPSLSRLWRGASPLQTFCRCLPTEN